MSILTQREIPPIKLVAFDLDGTLLGENREISERNRAAVDELKKQGYRVLVTTGRSLPEAREVCGDVYFDGYVCSNGMVIYDENLQVLHEDWIPGSAVLTVLGQLRAAKINYELHDQYGNVYVIEEDAEFIKPRPWKTNIKPEQELYSDIEQGRLKIVKFLILTKHSQIIIADHLQVRGLPVDVIIVNPYNVEINKAGINKWVGIQHQLRRYDVAPQEVLAFGDSANDLEILKKAGWSVAMDNARPEIKDGADDTTLDHKEDGVAYYLENYIL